MQYLDYINFLRSILTISQKKKLIFLIFLMIILVLFESLSFGLIVPIVESLLSNDNKFNIFDKFNFFNIENKFLFYSSFFFTAYIFKILFNIFFAWYETNFFSNVLALQRSPEYSSLFVFSRVFLPTPA